MRAGRMVRTNASGAGGCGAGAGAGGRVQDLGGYGLAG
jgi:hypothetical protein